MERTRRAAVVGVAVTALAGSALAAVAVAVGACSSDNFSAAQDAASEAFAPDSSGDGTVTEGGVTRGCASLSPRPTFCADFDEGSVTAGWDSVDHPSYATVALDTRFAVSAPASALVHVDGANPECAYQRLHYALARAFTHATVSFELRGGDDVGGAFPGGVMLALAFGTNAGKALLLVDTSPFGSTMHEQYVEEAGNADRKIPFPIVGAGAWHAFVLDVDLSVTPPTYGLTIDGRTALDPTPFLAPLGTAGAGVDLQVGPFCFAADAGPMDVRFDDVVLDLR